MDTFCNWISTSSRTKSIAIRFSRKERQLCATSIGNCVAARAFSRFSLRSSRRSVSTAVSDSFLPSSSFQNSISLILCENLWSLLCWILRVVASVSLRSLSHSARSRSAAARSCSALVKLRRLDVCHSEGWYLGGDWTSLAMIEGASTPKASK